jgi:uncharacterized RDD family membrane protein YckC
MTQNFCPNCGAELMYKEAEICPTCGVRIKEPPKPAGEKYAGFWIRFLAYIIDGIILFIIGFGIAFIIGLTWGVANYSPYSNIYNSSSFLGVAIIIYGLVIVITWLYFAYQESSIKQATIGKQALGLIVTDLEGNRLSFGRATGRWLAKILSGIILGIGFIIIGLTEKKQGLHDMIASTYVVYKDRQ